MRTKLWLIILITLAAVFVDLPKLPLGMVTIPQISLPFNKKIPKQSINFSEIIGAIPLKLGLDLQGGSQLVLEAEMEKIKNEDKDSALESAKEVIERRVNLFGVSEAEVQTSKVGDRRRILVSLPGVSDASSAANLVGKTAQLDFRELVESTDSATPSSILDSFKTTGLTGGDLTKAQVSFSGGNQAGPVVELQFNAEGGKKFAEITKRNINKPLGMFLDDQPLSWPPPTVNQEILGGNAVISGGFTTETAKRLAVQLNAGALKVPVKVVDQRSIGATLGQESINRSLIAGIIGLITVMLYMLFYYGLYGLIADIALILYALFSVAVFKTGLFILPPVTLTLAGIAGFILSIGMAVDANILIFERIKEEKRWGKNNRIAVDAGFKRAWSSIRDSNISSLLTAGILYSMGTGPVRGFAITLAIGVFISMITAISITRTILRIFVK